MITRDLHVHTTFSDGIADPETVVRAAVSRGMTCLGFSDHSYTGFDESWCMSREGTAEYVSVIRKLAEKYACRLEVLCGVEQDIFGSLPVTPFDYVIGSVHYMLIEGEYIPVDESPQTLISAAERHFGGDLISLAEVYYETVSGVVEKTNADIIGHFDLITKFNEGGALFDGSDPRYLKARKAAADALLKTGRPFEINTGAISRGWRTTPYPESDILEYLWENGAKFILSSDAHDPANLCFGFDKYESLL